jgi:ssDNA-specific exonuclease RecJ
MKLRVKIPENSIPKKHFSKINVDATRLSAVRKNFQMPREKALVPLLLEEGSPAFAGLLYFFSKGFASMFSSSFPQKETFPWYYKTLLRLSNHNHQKEKGITRKQEPSLEHSS